MSYQNLDSIHGHDLDELDGDFAVEYPSVYRAGRYDRTLDGLSKWGNLVVTSGTGKGGDLVCIDLTMERSGITLYGSGYTLSEAINEVWNEMVDHVNALDHLEGLGLDVSGLGELVDRPDFDPSFQAPPISPIYTATTSNTAVTSTSPVYTPSTSATVSTYDVPLVPPMAEPVFAAAGEPFTPAKEAAIDEVVKAAIDPTGEGYVLALLIPVREGRA